MAENTIHFFTDQLLIETINNEYPFGCVVGKEHTEFNVTSIHKSKKPSSDVCYAYAAIDGQVFFQEDEKNSNLLNIALKPKKQHIIDGYTIKYFIYRGIQKSSLLNGNNIIDNNNSPQKEIDLLTKIWKAQIKLNHIKGTSNTPSKDILGLGFTSTSTGGFVNNPTDYIESYFYKISDDFHTWDVKLGDSIGIYNNDSIGFEIVVGNYLPTIKELRQPQTIFTVADYNKLGDNGSKFVNRVEREAILNYIDPCAFYGLFFDHKIKTVHGKKKKVEIVEMLSDVFVNANKLYIDIRDRHNQSHSFYFNNFKQITLSDASGIILNTEYHTNYWPFLFIDSSIINQSNISDDGTAFTLTFEDVNVPSIMFHLAQGFYKEDYPKLKKKLIEVPTNSNTCTINLMLHSCNVKGVGKIVPTIVKARHLIKVADSLPLDEFELESQTYIDNLFKLNDIYDASGNMIFPFNPTKPCCWRMLDEEVFVDEDSGYVGGYMAKVGYAKDNNGYYFFGFSSGDELRRSSIDPFLLSGESEDKNFIENKLFPVFDSISIAGKFLKISSVDIKGYDDTLFNIVSSPSNKAYPSSHNVIYLLIDKSDVILNNQLLPVIHVIELPRRLVIRNILPNQLDDLNNTYKEMSLGVSGYKLASTLLKEDCLTNIKFYKYGD
jgi:hypothetical protein